MTFVPLSEIGTVRLGYKSLQNQFFYLDAQTIERFCIEPEFLTPILMRRDINSHRYLQASATTKWLFNCTRPEGDLRGTGAIRYINAMGATAAARKKQSGRTHTVRQALTAQAGGLWYAPKARPHRHHVWLRKAMDVVFAPCLFSTPTLVDQRFNSVEPKESITWQEIAAALTTTVFSYGLEIAGSTSLGAGALEAPTSKLRGYPVLAISQLNTEDRASLLALAEAVWANESPMNWGDPRCRVGTRLKALDRCVLELTGSSVSLGTLYDDFRHVCLTRIAIAKDKQKKTRRIASDNIGAVARNIAEAVVPQLEPRNFPDDSADQPESKLHFHFQPERIRTIRTAALLDYSDISVMDAAGTLIFHGSYPKSISEAIVRALLYGRSTFYLADDPTDTSSILAEFIEFISSIDAQIRQLVSDSAVGTGYETQLRDRVYQELRIHPLIALPTLPNEITFRIGSGAISLGDYQED